jgi:hypothetical protein
MKLLQTLAIAVAALGAQAARNTEVTVRKPGAAAAGSGH